MAKYQKEQFKEGKIYFACVKETSVHGWFGSGNWVEHCRKEVNGPGAWIRNTVNWESPCGVGRNYP